MYIVTINDKVVYIDNNCPISVSEGLVVNEVQSIPKYNKQTEELYYSDGVFTIRERGVKDVHKV